MSETAIALRLEALKLAYRFDKTPEQVIEVAAALADWLETGRTPKADKPRKGPAAPD